ncbi:MAG: CPBP family intramembrane glutamic endopeptidase [Candidatus Omnitrophota bacterium]
MNNAAVLPDVSSKGFKTESSFDFSVCPWSIKDAFVVLIYSIAIFLVFSFWLALGYSILHLIVPNRFVFLSTEYLNSLKHFYIIFVFYVSLFLSLKIKIFKKYHIENLNFFICRKSVLSDVVYGIKAYFKFLIIMLVSVAMFLLVVSMLDMVFFSSMKGKVDLFFNAVQIEKQVVVSHAAGAFGTVILLIFAPFFEELYFRGCLYRALRARYACGAAILVSSLIFSLLHGHFFLFFYVLVIGLILAYIYEKRRSLVAPLTFHALNNLVVILFFM